MNRSSPWTNYYVARYNLEVRAPNNLQFISSSHESNTTTFPPWSRQASSELDQSAVECFGTCRLIHLPRFANHPPILAAYRAFPSIPCWHFCISQRRQVVHHFDLVIHRLGGHARPKCWWRKKHLEKEPCSMMRISTLVNRY